MQVIGCGDIGAVSKLVTTKTGDTLSMSVRKVELEPIEFAPPCYTQGIQPKVKGAEEKISTGLARLHDEDPSFETCLLYTSHPWHFVSPDNSLLRIAYHFFAFCTIGKSKKSAIP